MWEVGLASNDRGRLVDPHYPVYFQSGDLCKRESLPVNRQPSTVNHQLPFPVNCQPSTVNFPFPSTILTPGDRDHIPHRQEDSKCEEKNTTGYKDS